MNTDTSSGKPCGKIELIMGPMFSGKTSELIRRMRRYEIAHHRCLMIKFEKDVRNDIEDIATHDRQRFSAVSSKTLAILKPMVADCDVIGIDGGQFFPDIVSFAEEMANSQKTVIVAALDGTFQRKAFENIVQLIPLSENVVKLTAVCQICFDEAAFTKRKCTDTVVEMIGGDDTYMAVCRHCYRLKE